MQSSQIMGWSRFQCWRFCELNFSGHNFAHNNCLPLNKICGYLNSGPTIWGWVTFQRTPFWSRQILNWDVSPNSYSPPLLINNDCSLMCAVTTGPGGQVKLTAVTTTSPHHPCIIDQPVFQHASFFSNIWNALWEMHMARLLHVN